MSYGPGNPSTRYNGHLLMLIFFMSSFQVEKVELPFDKMKDMRRNFVFIEFDKEETVTKILSQDNHKIGDEEVSTITFLV